MQIPPTLAEQVLTFIRLEDLLELAQQLIRLPTVNPPGDVREAAAVCADFLRAAGFTIELDAAEPTKPNLIARFGTEPGPLLLWNS
ncbi:MAG: M20 family peptidase, partial [Thermomicrobium sp.]